MHLGLWLKELRLDHGMCRGPWGLEERTSRSRQSHQRPGRRVAHVHRPAGDAVFMESASSSPKYGLPSVFESPVFKMRHTGCYLI